MSLKWLVFGDLLNLDRACLRCLIASLQSPLYHGLILVGFVEVCGIHSLDISISEEVKSDIGSEDSLKLSGINFPFHRVLISILPKNHAGPVEKLISDFFRMPKKVGT